MKLFAIADLHLANAANRGALVTLPPHDNDWLILAGDIGETEAHLHFALSTLTPKFAQILWVPGNHDLWTMPTQVDDQRGVAKYRRLVSICRQYGALTPEDPYPFWSGEGSRCILAPLFTLYDYSFRPDDVSETDALHWAEDTGVVASDEFLLHPDPYLTRQAWCEARCRVTEQRLHEAAQQAPLILINHWPLKYDLVNLKYIPRFSLWCGTRNTEDWHIRFNALAVIYGHLHVPGSHVRDGVRFEEVSWGYPRNWDQRLGLMPYLRQILPAPTLEIHP